jgi:hypothetical protein
MTETTKTGRGALRSVLIAGIIIAAFVGSYTLAAARSRGAASSATSSGGLTQAFNGTSAATGDTGAGAACACCGGSGSSEPIEGAAVVEGDVQRITVDLSTGSYDPNVIKLIPGVPAEITFGQSSGCTAQVQSKDLGFFEDLTAGPVTVKLPALQPGTYAFSCGMEMVFGSIVVEEAPTS